MEAMFCLNHLAKHLQARGRLVEAEPLADEPWKPSGAPSGMSAAEPLADELKNQAAHPRGRAPEPADLLSNFARLRRARGRLEEVMFGLNILATHPHPKISQTTCQVAVGPRPP